MNVYFTADSHFGHKNMIRSLSSWTDQAQCRDFGSLAEMNEALIAGINGVVRPEDVLYHLGDFNFGGIKNLYDFRRRLLCDTIHLIQGNHDFNHGQVDSDPFLSEFASIQPYKEITVEGQMIVLNHYAQRVWNNQGKGAWHLYGHSHGSLPQLRNFSMDVGVDSPKGFDATPWSMDALRMEFNRDVILTGDHHNEKTQNPHFRD